MKAKYVALNTLTAWLASINCAHAASSARVYNSGILVLAFIGFVALVVVVQMIPAILTLVGMIKGAAKDARGKAVDARASE